MDDTTRPEDTIEDLVRRARQGDQDAIRRLYEENFYRVVAFLQRRRFSLPQATAMDIAQDAMRIALFEGLHKLKEARKFRAWLLGIAANLALREFRSRAPLSATDLAEFVSPGPTGLDKAIQNESAERIRRVVAEELSPRQREAVTLYYFEQRPIKDVASRMGVAVGTVKATLGQARVVLRARLLEGRDGTDREIEGEQGEVKK